MMLTIYASLIRWLDELPTLPQPIRMAMVVAMHLVLFAAAYMGSFLIRFDFSIPDTWMATVWTGLGLVLAAKMIVFGLLRMYQGWWRYVSIYDLLTLTRALVVAGIAFVLVNVFTGLITPPRSIYIIDFGLSLVLVGGARGSLRLMREALHSRTAEGPERQNVLILGAGDTGETLLREINKNRNLPYKPIGFLDDAPHKQGLKIHNVSVLGRIDELKHYADKHNVATVLIAMPSADREQLRRVVNIAKDAGVETRILPAVETILSSGGLVTNQIREISLSDLLGRAPVRLDMQSIGSLLQGKRVMVTGAGGSIGSEICRQVLRFAPEELIMIERAETPLFFIHRELRGEHGESIIPYVASISDPDRMREIFAHHTPDVILHAAAYKHVPLMEANPCEAVKNNITGTQVLTDLAIEHGVSAFVLISTDKAVNPTSVMGATKRITELLLMKAQQRQENKTRFCAVRFGNVLGSNGSVVPIFTEQIRKGGPVTVTHPEMTRYFMTIPEAVQLVLQAGALGQGGEIFILDMGEPVKIADLARDMIRLSGLSETDIEIIYTGIRPGEKLFEELAINTDEMDKTRHKKIFVAPEEVEGIQLLGEHYATLIQTAEDGNEQEVRQLLKQIIPTYSTPKLPKNVVSLRKTHPTSPPEKTNERA
ncbi:MAG: nucleoside-diphosphate sugar epimerase/dehydratase [Myxococcota bacterium]|jgi:FlaA1/EpsC-like NDP-sugar epimerase|nr:nucleoside-diphosphate sugar epimerase/dehydratase [Myxococcota bacterium]